MVQSQYPVNNKFFIAIRYLYLCCIYSIQEFFFLCFPSIMVPFFKEEKVKENNHRINSSIIMATDDGKHIYLNVTVSLWYKEFYPSPPPPPVLKTRT